MAIKTAAEKLQGHDSAGKNNNIEKETSVISATIDEFDTVKIYNNEVIFDENNPEDNPPTSLQMYQGEQFLMCPPFGTSNAIANNSWMGEEDEPIDRFTYMEEWLRLYKDLSSIGMVYIAPTHPKLQDQIYISNGVWVPFHANQYCVMPNFKVEGRKENKELGIPGENAINAPFMKMLGYKLVYIPEFDENGEPMYFEGSADIKMINCENPHATVWVCGTGIRTSENAARWIENWMNEVDEDPNSAHKVISYPQLDEDEYHMDCSIFVADANHAVLNTALIKESEELRKAVEEISKYITVIPCDDIEILKAGLCNSLRAGNNIFMGSDINLLEGSEYVEDYNIEKRRIEFMQDVANKLGLNLNIYCLSQALLGGAMLSCNVADLRGWQFLKEYSWSFKY
nr:MAG TPA: N-Dimethylarginine dimethylaminohydrolase [Caudoviricetes sp.]